MKDIKGAMEDYKSVVDLDSSVAGAQQGLKRCRAALGIKGGGGGGGGGNVITEEDKRMLDEAKNRVEEVARQKLRAQQQNTSASSELRRAELTLDQLKTIPDDRAVYRGVGRAFLRAPKEEVVAGLQSTATKAEYKIGVCAKTLKYLEQQEKEADDAFMEVVNTFQRKAAAAGKQ